MAATLTRPLAAFQVQAMAMTFPPALPLVLPLALSLALTLLLCLPAPALAFWGDYGPDPAPELFGVRLGDDIRNYKGMELLAGHYEPGEAKIYRRKTDKGQTFEGISLWEEGYPDWRPVYVTYENKIYDISFHVHPEDYDRVVQKISSTFGPPAGYNKFNFGDSMSGHIWMDSEVFIRAFRKGYFYIQWLPIVQRISDEFTEWNNPVSFDGITLGGKIDNIYFDSMEIYHEGPELIHYMAKWALRGGMKTCVFSTYRGVVYGSMLSG